MRDPPSPLPVRLPTLFASLKFRLVVLCVVTGLAAAGGAAVAVLHTTQSELQRQLLASDRVDRERTAALLGGKLETLKETLVLVAAHLRRDHWGDADAVAAFLMDRPTLNAMFDNVVAVAADGRMLARIERGQKTSSLPNIADRGYFQRVMQGDQPVVSEPLVGRASKEPQIIIAVPVLGPQGRPLGMIGGALRLRSTGLFADLGAARDDTVRDLVIDRNGVVLSHPDASRILGRAAQEPGLKAVFTRWHGAGSPIDVAASADLADEHLVSMAGIPLSDWALVRLTPQAAALAPVAAARRAAAWAALTAGVLSSLLAGVVAWTIVRPIGQLRDRAQRMLAGNAEPNEPWPQQAGEIGAMSAAFQQLLQSRESQSAGRQALLMQMQAVFDYADVGLVLTREGRFEMVSEPFCRTVGYPREQLVGQFTKGFYPSEEAFDHFSAAAGPALVAHGAFDGEFQLRRNGGGLFWARMRGRAVAPGDVTKGTIWVITDVSAEREQRERLRWAASHDPLTGLTNRAACESLLEDATATADRAPFCALFIDLDRFKQVNDTAGHAAGDALLRELSRELSARVRRSDTLARMGGDEFAVLLPQCPVPQAQALAEKLRATVEDHRLVWEGREHRVGASIGLVAVDGSFASAAAVLRAADAACYAAKRAGRNQVALAAA